MSVVVRVGGVRGRHPLPVERYLIDESETDVRTAHVRAYEAMKRLLAELPPGSTVQFYPTGLTAVTLAAVAAAVNAAWRSVGTREAYSGEGPRPPRLEIWEWDREAAQYRCTFVVSGSYEPLTLDDSGVWRPAMGPVKGVVMQ